LLAAALLASGVSWLRAADAPTAPAPVPPQVAIARPTEAEAAQLNAALQKAAGSDAALKALLAKYPNPVRIPRANPATLPALNPGYRQRHAGFVEIAKQGNIDVLFMGDSITDWWRRDATAQQPAGGKAVFEKYFGSLKLANFGIAGDTTQGVLLRLRDGEGQGYSPKAVMLMIGTNNAGTCSTEEIAEGVGAVVLELRKNFPAAKILLLGIFPRANPGDAVRKTVLDVNPIIAKLHDGKNIFYRDIGDKFLDATGNIPADIMGDKLHPTEKGYEIWAQAVKDQLAELMK
jgi:lysophospholipase L1-like esterase